MMKYRDFHFATTTDELFCKLVCWVISLAVIVVEFLNIGVDLFETALAVPTFVFALSCGSDTFIAISRKEHKGAKVIHRIFLLAYLYVAVLCLSMQWGLDNVPKSIIYSFFVIFVGIFCLMCIDLFLIDLDSKDKEKCKSKEELRKIFDDYLKGPQ